MKSSVRIAVAAAFVLAATAIAAGPVAASPLPHASGHVFVQSDNLSGNTSARLEGHELSPQVLELFQRYANHEVTYEEVVALVDSGALDEVQHRQGTPLG
jgi:hypothetical protein